MLAFNIQSRLFHSSSKVIVPHKKCGDIFVPCEIHEGKKSFFLNLGWNRRQFHVRSTRTIMRQPFAVQAVASGLEDTQVSSSQFQEFSVTTSRTDKANEFKACVDVFGSRTQAVFDDVFSKMVADAQPIPGFRKVKGGKTPNIPQNILMEIFGPSKVYQQVIKKVINITISEYVQKENLSVGKSLQVQQTFEDLEAAFEPGEQFRFEAILQYQD